MAIPKGLWNETGVGSAWWDSLAINVGWWDQDLLEPAAGGGSTAYTLAGLHGAYTYTGQSATVAVARFLSGSAGSYTYSGQSATVTWAHKLAGNAGAYAYAGQPAELTYAPGATTINYTLEGSAGAYTYTGQTASLTFARALAGDTTMSGDITLQVWAGRVSACGWNPA